jgi:hypothetical protein
MANNLKKKIVRQNNYNEKDFSESKINHRIKIKNTFTHFIYIMINMI